MSPFGRLFTASALSNLGDGLRLTALPLLAASLTRDPAVIATMSAVIWLPWLLFGAFGGAIVDRVRRVRLLLSAQLFRVLVVGVLAALVWTGHASIGLLFVAAFLFGIGEVLADTTMQTLIPSIVPEDELERANGQLYASQTVTNEFVGPPVGSVLFATVGAAPFALGALSWGLSALVLVRLKVEHVARTAVDATSLIEDIATGARWLWHQPVLRALVVWAAVVNAALVSFGSLYVLFALEILSLPEAAFGFLTAAAGVGGVAGTLVARRIVRRFGRSAVIRGGSLITGLAAAAAGLTSSPLLFAALLVPLTASAAVIIVILTALRQTIVPNAMLGRATATMRMFTYGAIPFGALAGGWLAQALGLRAPFVAGGLIVAASGLLIGRWVTAAAIDRARAAARSEPPPAQGTA